MAKLYALSVGAINGRQVRITLGDGERYDVQTKLTKAAIKDVGGRQTSAQLGFPRHRCLIGCVAISCAGRKLRTSIGRANQVDLRRFRVKCQASKGRRLRVGLLKQPRAPSRPCERMVMKAFCQYREGKEGTGHVAAVERLVRRVFHVHLGKRHTIVRIRTRTTGDGTHYRGVPQKITCQLVQHAENHGFIISSRCASAAH
jgi:hypothetical protein